MRRRVGPLLIGRTLLVLLATGVASLVGAGTAFAHDELRGSSPANGATVETVPATVELLSSADVAPSFATATVSSADGRRWESGPATVQGTTVRVGVRPDAPAGSYTVGYRVVSSDGHPVTGSITFRATGGNPASDRPSAEAVGPPPAASTPAQPVEQQAPFWPWVLGGVLLAGLAGIVIARLGRAGRG